MTRGALGLVALVGLMFRPEPAQVLPRVPAPPKAMSVMVMVTCEGSVRGWATPYAANLAATAAHLTEDCAALGWQSPLKSGPFRVIKRKYESDQDGAPLADYALLVSDVRFDSWATVSKRIPETGEYLYVRLFLPGNVTVDAPHVALGVDRHGFLHSDGIAHPGSSGSGAFNGAGELVAVHVGGYAPKNRQPTAVAEPIATVLR